jgi:hypothetical protein
MADTDPVTTSPDDGEEPGGGVDAEKQIAYYLRMLADDNSAKRWKADLLGGLRIPAAQTRSSIRFLTRIFG